MLVLGYYQQDHGCMKVPYYNFEVYISNDYLTDVLWVVSVLWLYDELGEVDYHQGSCLSGCIYAISL